MAQRKDRLTAKPSDTVVELAEWVQSAKHAPVARMYLRQSELEYRLQAKRLRVYERVADGIGKLGGGSLLTTTIALIIGGQIGWPIVCIALVTLLFFVSGTILSALFEYRGAAWDIEADRVVAALAESKQEKSDG